MRTTLNIDDHLMDRLRRESVARGVTLTRQIQDTLARGLNATPLPREEPHTFAVFDLDFPTPVDVADRDAVEALIGDVP